MTTEIIVGIITGLCGIVASLLTGFLTANHQKNKSKYTFLISQYNIKLELFRLLAYKIEEYKIIYYIEPPHYRSNK